jgi:hypothetical protein
MSVQNNQRFKAGPQCLLTMPLMINDSENAEFTTGAGTAVNTGKTAGEGHDEIGGNLSTPAVARTGIMQFGGLQGRATAIDVTAFLDIEDGKNHAGYTTHGINNTGTKHVTVAGQSNIFDVRVSKAPVTGSHIAPRLGGGNLTVIDYATGAVAVNAELTSDRWVRVYYLPWRSNAATTMHLGNAANYFLTSTLTGCTFAVYGTRTAPTVTHANNGAQPDLNLSQTYMTHLLDQIKTDEAVVANTALANNEERFTTHDYKLRAAPYLNGKIDKGYIIQNAKTHTIVVATGTPGAANGLSIASRWCCSAIRGTGSRGSSVRGTRSGSSSSRRAGSGPPAGDRWTRTFGIESLQAAGLGLGCLFLAAARQSAGFERTEQGGGDCGDVVHRALKRLFIRLRRPGESADLSDELQ